MGLRCKSKRSAATKHPLTYPVILGISLLLGILGGGFASQRIHIYQQAQKAHTALHEFSLSMSEKHFAPVVAVLDKLAHHPQLIATIAGSARPDNPAALTLLSDSKYLLDTSLVYLLDAKGNVVACTPYANGKKTLTGNNYSFRPYFIESLKTGKNYSYAALGVTTGRRGLYFSSPVRQNNKIIGVVVIKIGLAFIDRELQTYPFPCALIDKNGIIFASNQGDWLFKAAYGLKADIRKRLRASRQYADKPLNILPVNLFAAKVIFGNKTLLPVHNRPTMNGFSFALLYPLTSPSPRFAIFIIILSTMILFLFVSIITAWRDRKRILRHLESSEKKYRTIIDNLQILFFRLDQDDKFILVSPAMDKVYTTAAGNDLLGEHLAQIYHQPEQADALLRALAESEGVIRDYECQLRKGDGTIARVLFNASYYYDVDDAKHGVEGVIYDVSDKSKLQQRLNLLSTAIDAAANTIVITDTDGTILWVNRAFTRLTGYSFDEAVGIKPDILKSGHHDDSFYKEMWETINSGNIWYGEVINQRKNGEIYHEEMSITPVKNYLGENTNFIAIKHDVSERKQAEREKEEHLIKERKARQQIAREKQRAEKANMAKRYFLLNMSQKIRTPLNAIIDMTDTELQTDLSDSQRNNLMSIADSSRNLLHILNEILEFFRIEEGQLELDHTGFRLGDILTPILASFSARAAEKNIVFKQKILEPDCMLLGDPAKFRQIVENICDNAIKFTETGYVEITVNWDRPAASRSRCLIYCVVRDTGIGINSEEQNKIFEAFSQADNSLSGKYTGVGLGLSISRRLLSMMGGKIQLESSPGQGSTFSFSIEFDMDESTIASSPAAISTNSFPDLSDIKILLAEENDFYRLLASEMLKKQNCQVSSANNGGQVLDMLKKGGSFDLLLMDTQMPLMNGQTLSEIIHRADNLLPQNIPIIALLPYAAEGDGSKSRAGGMSGCISKPFDPDQFFAEIGKCLPNSHNIPTASGSISTG